MGCKYTLFQKINPKPSSQVQLLWTPPSRVDLIFLKGIRENVSAKCSSPFFETKMHLEHRRLGFGQDFVLDPKLRLPLFWSPQPLLKERDFHATLRRWRYFVRFEVQGFVGIVGASTSIKCRIRSENPQISGIRRQFRRVRFKLERWLLESEGRTLRAGINLKHPNFGILNQSL